MCVCVCLKPHVYVSSNLLVYMNQCVMRNMFMIIPLFTLIRHVIELFVVITVERHVSHCNILSA